MIVSLWPGDVLAVELLVLAVEADVLAVDEDVGH
jgi:hypothetical protein